MAEAALRALYPTVRAPVDESPARVEEVRRTLLSAHLPTAGLDAPLKWNGYSPQSPHAKQQAFLACDSVQTLLFGGSAGPGKSSGLLMAALQYCDVPGYHALILRRSFSELVKAGSLISRAREWLAGTDAVWHGALYNFEFPSGATLEFGHLERDDAVHAFQSAEFQFIGFDELTHFTEFQFSYMHSRLRRLKGSSVPLRMRAASNPGGPGHNWVRRSFPVMETDTPESKDGYGFVPATLDDNDYLDKEAYERSLDILDPYTKAQLRHGSWTARPPGNWAYDHDHLDAAMELGSRMKDAWKAGELRPAGGIQYFGADFGEHACVVIGWPLEGGGWWIAKEHAWCASEPDVEAFTVIEKADALGDFHVERLRFDASRPESSRLMLRTFKKERGADYAKASPISFAKYKRMSVRHLRALLFRSWMASAGDTGEAIETVDTTGFASGAIGVNSEWCPILSERLYKIEREPADMDQLVKKDDDENDALLSLIAPDARKAQKLPGAPKPEAVESERARRVAADAEKLMQSKLSGG